MALYPATVWAARSAIALADTPWTHQVAGEPQRLLRGVVADEKLGPAVRQEAGLRLLMAESTGWPGQRRIAALRELLAATTERNVKRQILETVLVMILQGHNQWTPQAVSTAGEILDAAATADQAERVLARLATAAKESRDADTLDRVIAVVGRFAAKDAAISRQAAIVRVEATISRAIVEPDLPAVDAALLGRSRDTRPFGRASGGPRPDGSRESTPRQAIHGRGTEAGGPGRTGGGASGYHDGQGPLPVRPGRRPAGVSEPACRNRLAPRTRGSVGDCGGAV